MPTIDADAHVIESERTWSYLAPDERRYAPMMLEMIAGETQEQVGPAPTRRYLYPLRRRGRIVTAGHFNIRAGAN